MFWRRFLLVGTLFVVGACAPANHKPGASTVRAQAIFPPGFEAGANLHSAPQLDRLHAMGAKWVRLNLDWDSIEPAEGVWNFTGTDATIAAAEKTGLKIYGCLLYTPPWASSTGLSKGVPKAGTWEAYVRAVTAHYCGRIQVYGIWNEPNLEEYWVGNARDYVQRLLLPASLIIHHEDPAALVAGPDLAHLSSGAISVPQFYRELKQYGGAEALDVISHHVYGHRDFEAKLVGAKLFGITYRAGLQQMLQEAGLQNKPLWLTETGVNARDGGEEKQAEELEVQWRVLAGQTWIKKAFVYAWADDGDQNSRWGLLRADGAVKPAYEAMERLLLPLPAEGPLL